MPDECSVSMYTVLDEADRVEAGGKNNYCDNTNPTSFKNVWLISTKFDKIHHSYYGKIGFSY